MTYQVKIMSGSIKEINSVLKALNLDVWTGIDVRNRELAEQIARDVRYIAPLIEVDVTEVQ